MVASLQAAELRSGREVAPAICVLRPQVRPYGPVNSRWPVCVDPVRGESHGLDSPPRAPRDLDIRIFFFDA